jgi:hypothetical protein
LQKRPDDIVAKSKSRKASYPEVVAMGCILNGCAVLTVLVVAAAFDLPVLTDRQPDHQGGVFIGGHRRRQRCYLRVGIDNQWYMGNAALAIGGTDTAACGSTSRSPIKADTSRQAHFGVPT